MPSRHSPHASEASLSRSALPTPPVLGVPDACGARPAKKARRGTFPAPCHSLALSGCLQLLSVLRFHGNIAPGTGSVSEVSADDCPPIPWRSAGKEDFIGTCRWRAVFCGTETFPYHKKARPGSGTGGFLLRSRKPYKNNAMAQNKGGRPKAADLKRHIYRFRLNDEQNTRFQQMLSEAGLTDNMSKFILARLFG